jgi:hypothetical protein
VCHDLLADPKLYVFLLHIDEEQAAQTRGGGCACGGRLHRADYQRKPRGGPRELGPAYRLRRSFCCAICRKRHTPMSVRFLGRRVYLGAVVVLASAMRYGLTLKRVAQLTDWFGVPRQTLDRWRHWWHVDFVDSGFWQDTRDRFMPPLQLSTLPASLLYRFSGADLLERMLFALRFLAPLTSRREGR